MKKQLEVRWGLKSYIESVMEEAAQNGSPLMRTMFYEFPEDEKCWNITDQYMFGARYLVAPILELGQRSRKVYLPQGTWKNINDGKICEGGCVIEADAPLAYIPVFEKMS